MFVCLFAVNAKTTERINAKCSGITKNDPESVLQGLKLPVLVLLGRYRDSPGFPFATDRHFYLSPTSGSCLDASQRQRQLRATSLLIAYYFMYRGMFSYYYVTVIHLLGIVLTVILVLGLG